MEKAFSESTNSYKMINRVKRSQNIIILETFEFKEVFKGGTFPNFSPVLKICTVILEFLIFQYSGQLENVL